MPDTATINRSFRRRHFASSPVYLSEEDRKNRKTRFRASSSSESRINNPFTLVPTPITTFTKAVSQKKKPSLISVTLHFAMVLDHRGGKSSSPPSWPPGRPPHPYPSTPLDTRAPSAIRHAPSGVIWNPQAAAPCTGFWPHRSCEISRPGSVSAVRHQKGLWYGGRRISHPRKDKYRDDLPPCISTSAGGDKTCTVVGRQGVGAQRRARRLHERGRSSEGSFLTNRQAEPGFPPRPAVTGQASGLPAEGSQCDHLHCKRLAPNLTKKEWCPVSASQRQS